MSPFFKGIYNSQQGLSTLKQAAKEKNPYLVSSALGKIGLSVMIIGCAITYASFRFSLQKNPSLVQQRRDTDKQREREEGALLLTKLSKER